MKTKPTPKRDSIKKLSPTEMSTLGALLERGIYHEQIAVTALCPDDGTDYGTVELGGVCDHSDLLTVELMLGGLKYLWARHLSAPSGKKKNRK